MHITVMITASGSYISYHIVIYRRLQINQCRRVYPVFCGSRQRGSGRRDDERRRRPARDAGGRDGHARRRARHGRDHGDRRWTAASPSPGCGPGTYTVTISDFPEDVSFEMVSVEVEVEVGDVGSADFTGHFIRTSAVEGEVIIDERGPSRRDGDAGPAVPPTRASPWRPTSTARTGSRTCAPATTRSAISDFDTRDYEFALPRRGT